MTRRLLSSGSPFEAAIGYSRAVVDGDWCFVSGTTGYDYATMTLPESAGRQARDALANVERALGEAGFGLRDVVRARYVVAQREDWAAVAPVLGEALAAIRPAATMIVAGLMLPEMLVEIEVTAKRRPAP